MEGNVRKHLLNQILGELDIIDLRNGSHTDAAKLVLACRRAPVRITLYRTGDPAVWPESHETFFEDLEGRALATWKDGCEETERLFSAFQEGLEILLEFEGESEQCNCNEQLNVLLDSLSTRTQTEPTKLPRPQKRKVMNTPEPNRISVVAIHTASGF